MLGKLLAERQESREYWELSGTGIFVRFTMCEVSMLGLFLFPVSIDPAQLALGQSRTELGAYQKLRERSKVWSQQSSQPCTFR